MPTSPIDLEALLYSPSLTPPSDSDSPHLRMLYNKHLQENMTNLKKVDNYSTPKIVN